MPILQTLDSCQCSKAFQELKGKEELSQQLPVNCEEMTLIFSYQEAIYRGTESLKGDSKDGDLSPSKGHSATVHDKCDPADALKGVFLPREHTASCGAWCQELVDCKPSERG